MKKIFDKNIYTLVLHRYAKYPILLVEALGMFLGLFVFCTGQLGPNKNVGLGIFQDEQEYMRLTTEIAQSGLRAYVIYNDVNLTNDTNMVLASEAQAQL